MKPDCTGFLKLQQVLSTKRLIKNKYLIVTNVIISKYNTLCADKLCTQGSDSVC